jgi:hypothetical protein
MWKRSCEFVQFGRYSRSARFSILAELLVGARVEPLVEFLDFSGTGSFDSTEAPPQILLFSCAGEEDPD